MPDMKDSSFSPPSVAPVDILALPEGGSFNRLAQFIATVLQADIALVELAGGWGVWRSSADQARPETSIAAGDSAAALSRLSNPLAAEENGFAFYACVPLRVDQINFGKLVIVNRSPRDVGAEEIALLRQLADVIIEAFELRVAASRQVLRA
jgi:GAF domain-containing protein